MSVETEWMAIPQSKLESLVASIPKRIKVVLAAGVATHDEFWNFFLGFLALIHLFLCLIGKRDVNKYVYMLICVSKCQIMKIIFFFHSLFCALRQLQTDSMYTSPSPLYCTSSIL